MVLQVSVMMNGDLCQDFGSICGTSGSSAC